MIPADGEHVETVVLGGDRDVVAARRAVSRTMDKLGARAVRKTRFVTAVSEIARNAVMHGGGGELHVFIHNTPSRISVVCQDRGEGIADLDSAMADGFSTADSMGKGLGGAKRLSDEFEVETTQGGGTTVRMASGI